MDMDLGKSVAGSSSSSRQIREMENKKQGWLLLVEILLILNLPYSLAFWGNENKINTAVFLSPKFVLGPGSVENRFYYNVNFPRGHIALKSFNAEVIDEAGNPVPLHETYLHHWAVGRYFVHKGVEILEFDDHAKLKKSDYMFVRNSGICQDESVAQLFGLGSETRKTATHIPDPYGIEVGNPAEIPSEFEEQWLLNIHAIDTRGAEDKLGCTECRCDLYNVTVDEYGRPLRPDYIGGLLCCYDHTRCKVKQGFESVRRTLYLRYTVKWVDMDSSVLPVKVYIFDITDTWKRTRTSTGINAEHQCKVEYDIEPCHATRLADDGCIDTRRISLDMPFGGYMIYGVAHQHSGGTGSALYREDGRLMCSSLPTYGEGEEPGNEAGYIVGMTTCYPQPGAIEISRGETLILESNYSRITHHTGVMGLFYILVADQLPKPMHTLHTVIQTQDSVTLIAILWAVVAMIGVVAVIAVAIHHRFKRGGEDGYEAIGMSDYISGRNSGICQNLGQFFGLGSETRKTSTHIPDPYGIEFGNPAEIPSGFEEQWMLNVHAIDTRGVEDQLGCTECRFDLYNVTVDEYGRPLRPDYKGGLLCCYDHTQCKVKQGFEGVRRTLYLRYTVKWVDMDNSVLPVKVYIFDITDTWKKNRHSTGINTEHQCKVEYDIEPCHSTGMADDGCVDTRRISLDMPFDGYLIYGVAHQHSGGIGSALYREDGRVMCSSLPTYGEGEEAGNEAGYIVGMTTCYPQPGAIKISKGETLILESNYTSIRHHTGVMGLFYIMVADQLPKPMLILPAAVQTEDSIMLLTLLWAAVALTGVVAVISVAIRYQLKREGEDEYEAIGIVNVLWPVKHLRIPETLYIVWTFRHYMAACI
ncbi:hypothetical protein GQ457_15G007180 [Hibiscus cannabinus]